MEAQQAEALQNAPKPLKPFTPEQQARRRQLEGLELSRKRLLHDLESSSNPRHRQMLADSLAELERRIQEMTASDQPT